jgi:hypothetical protein
LAIEEEEKQINADGGDALIGGEKEEAEIEIL